MGLSGALDSILPVLLVLGTIFGTVLNSVLCVLIRRRTKKRAGEKVFLTLVMAGVVFNFALLCSTFLQMLVRKRLTAACPAFEAVSLIALGLIPSLLLHTFLAFYRPHWLTGWWTAALFAPALTVLYPAAGILTNPTVTFPANLTSSTLPFILWSMVASLATAFITFALSGEASREKEATFNETLGYTLLGLGMVLAVVALLVNVPAIPVVGPVAVVAALMAPNVLAFIFAYSVYRYNYLGYFMKESLFHTILASFALSIYFFGIRFLGEHLEQAYGLDFRVLEAAMMLGLLFAFDPVKQAVERLANRLFFKKFMHSRELLQNLSTEFNAAAIPNLPALMDRASITIKEAFGADGASVWLHGFDELGPSLGGPPLHPLPQELVVWIRANPNRVLDLHDVAPPEITQIMQDRHLSAVIPLAKDADVIGSIQLGLRDIEAPLTPNERQLLLLLANQVTMVFEKHQILEQKITLERKVLETEKLSSLGRLAAGVAHEIKNPLSSIKAIVQTTREDLGATNPLSDDLAVVLEEIERLSESVSRMLNYIKPELSAEKLVPVEGILDGVLEILRYESQKRRVTIVKQFATEVHYLRGQAEDLKSIMFNLVLNGLEAMPDGGTLTLATSSRRGESPHPRKPPPVVGWLGQAVSLLAKESSSTPAEVQSNTSDGADAPVAQRGRKWVVVEVADTGVGIPPERLGSIFEPFHTSKESGTGLGLAIVKQKVEELGGRISVTSCQGTRFTLELPVLGRARRTMDPANILIVDDERGARFAMRRALEKEGHQLSEAPNADEGIVRIKQGGIDLVFLDLQMPGKDGLTALGEIVTLTAPPLVVMVTAFGSEKTAVEAMKRGAYDYVSKPYDVEELRLLVKRASERIALRHENLKLKEELSRVKAGTDLLGGSTTMRRVLDRIDRVAPTEVTVLITGESGTGKELVAKALHRRSARGRGAFVVFDCSNVDTGLIRSELFGHEKGAYTGADLERAGSFERASGGTLFIDEVAELELDLQPRLLRVLETREVARLGSDKPRKVDVRLVAATNKDLTRMVKEGTFREDLYHRLSVVNVELPPLRERKEDIALLSARFVEEAARRFGRDVTGLSFEARALLTEQPWPGNVRQLKNAIESAVVLADGEMLTLDDFSALGPKGEGETVSDTPMLSSLEQLAGPIDTNLPFMEAKRRLILEFERRYIAAKLSNCQGNISRAARELGMHRQSLQQKLKSLGIKEPGE